MRKRGQGPTVHMTLQPIAEVPRHNPVAPINQKVVTDGPAWYTALEPVMANDTILKKLNDEGYTIDVPAVVEMLKEVAPVMAEQVPFEEPIASPPNPPEMLGSALLNITVLDDLKQEIAEAKSLAAQTEPAAPPPNSPDMLGSGLTEEENQSV